jgi:hypothetical protein
MRWLCLVLLVACSNADGTRGQCAEGGELEACPEAERTPEGACWRLVDCGAIPLDSGSDPNNQYAFDWNRCVNIIDGARTDQQRIVIDCIAASTCDSLKPNGNDRSQIACIVAGGLE